MTIIKRHKKILEMADSNMRILVTGAGGFIGSHLTELLVMKAMMSGPLFYNSKNSWGWLDTSDKRKDIEVVIR